MVLHIIVTFNCCYSIILALSIIYKMANFNKEEKESYQNSKSYIPFEGKLEAGHF